MSMLFKRIKDWATTITVFRTGDVIPVDGPSGTAKMSKDSLLELTAQNSLAGNVAPAFDPTKPNDDNGYAYYAGERVAYNGITYAFIVNKSSGAWDATKVEQVDSSEFLEKSDNLNGIARNVCGEEIDTDVFEQGNISIYGDFVAATNRVRAGLFLCVWKEMLASVPYYLKWRIIFWTQSGLLTPSELVDAGTNKVWQRGTKKIIVPVSATMFSIIVAKVDDSDISPSEAEFSLVGKNNNYNKTSSILAPVGVIYPVTSTTRIVSKFYRVPETQKISVNVVEGYKFRLLVYTGMTLGSKVVPFDYESTWQYSLRSIDFSTIPGAKYFIVCLAKDDDSSIGDADFSSVRIFSDIVDKFSGKKISILGDSISTFGGSVSDPDNSRFAVEGDPTYPGNRCRYPQSNLVTDVNNTYWMKLINSLGLILGINDSWAGSRVSNTSATDTGDVGPNRCISSMTRIGHLDDNGTPDIILVNAGTNDIGGNVTLGTFSYDDPSNYTDEQVAALDVSTFANAYRAMLIRLQKTYKSARIIVMLPNYTTSYYNPQKEDQYCEVVKEACDYFGVPYVDMRTAGITMFNRSSYLPDGIHYNAAGMSKIYEKIKLGFEENL